MKLLLIALSDSIHVVRWLQHLRDYGWDIHLFPSRDFGLTHPGFRDLTIHHSVAWRDPDLDPSVKFSCPLAATPREAVIARMRLKDSDPDYHPNRLVELIEELKPDLVHSMEFQYAGYLTAAVKTQLDHFPPWIATNWGSDVYLYGRLPEHRPRIENILNNCDYYSCECQRDVRLVRGLGYQGQVLPVFPNAGGLDLKRLELLREPGPTSGRRKIMLKGYQTWAGRSLFALRALEDCRDLLRDYEIIVYNADPVVEIAVELFRQDTGIPVRILPRETPHDEILRAHGSARISIGINISDGISTSFLEALAMGAFPIQSDSSAADEWIEHGAGGFLVSWKDHPGICQAIRQAVSDDVLVDRAEAINRPVVRQRLDQEQIRSLVGRFYLQVCQEQKISVTIPGVVPGEEDPL